VGYNVYVDGGLLMEIGNRIKVGDLIKVQSGCHFGGIKSGVVLEIIPARVDNNQSTDRMVVLGNDGHVHKSRVDYIMWGIVE
jgi:hypothetical protein